ncbi:MAG: HD domain-containing protein [Actinomycetota bacterium]|nr:HD domain-containing protein [Actinomycetota bacterium]
MEEAGFSGLRETGSIEGAGNTRPDGVMAFLKPHLEIDKELVIVFLLVAITGIIYYFVDNQRAFLNFFYLPVLLSAYLFGKRHGTYSAVLTTLIVVSLAYLVPGTFEYRPGHVVLYKWLDIVTWSGFLLLTGYFMGHLYEKKEKSREELAATHRGIVTMLSIIIDSVDKETRNHSYRVSRYAEILSRAAGLKADEREEIRTAALLHDLGKIGISAEILKKIGALSSTERDAMTKHASRGAAIVDLAGGTVKKIVPLILNHHERYDGKGYYGLKGDEIPLGAQIIAIADVYDALTSDRTYRRALPPEEVKKEITKGAGTQFNPKLVAHFERIFPALMDISSHELYNEVSAV